MVQSRACAGLALEPLTELLGRDFDSDLASEARVPGFVDLAHATGANRGDDLVRT